MFRSLRLKLTLTNTFVVGLILLFIFSGIYYLMKDDMIKQSDRIMHSIISEERLKPPHGFSGERRIPSNYFYVALDRNAIINSSSNLIYSQEELSLLVKEVTKNTKNEGYIKLNDEKFRFLKSSVYDNGASIKIAFCNLQNETEMMTRLMTTLFIIGLIATALGFCCSLFMADKALVPIKISWERQRDFVADASHELRTPLAVIQTNLELVMGNPTETVESQFKWLDNLLAESKIMAKLVDDLLFLARADSNQANVILEEFPLHILLEDTVNAFEPLANSKSITLEHDIDTDVLFYGSKNRIKQLVTILIDNALKYNNPGGHVLFSFKAKDNMVEISVTDTGEGIPKEHLKNIFDRFYRVETSRTRGNGGSGLGLSIAACIVKENNGTMSVTSIVKEGSTFKVLLPIKKV